MAIISILIAHKHDPANDAALKVALDCIINNTQCDYELLIDSTTPAEVYGVYNKLARQAQSEWLVFSNSDIFMAPGWDDAFISAASQDIIVAGVIVECGAIGVASANVQLNFGMTPDTYRREEFERWVKETPIIPSDDPWYFPSLHHRQAFLDMGGFDNSRGGFMIQPSDEDYWNAWRAAGKRVVRVPSFSYHLQNFSSHSEQQKAVRYE